MVQVLAAPQRKPSFSERLNQSMGAGFETAGRLAGEYQQKQLAQKERESISKLTGLDVSDIQDPKILQKIMELHGEGQNKAAQKAQLLQSNRAILRDIEKREGLQQGDLSAYEEDPKIALQTLKQPKKTQASQPIEPEQLRKMEDVRSQPGFSELDELGQYQALTRAGVSKENAEAESKLRGQQLTRTQQAVQSAYKAQEDFINETTSKYQGFETEMKPRLLQMQSMPPVDIIGPTASVFLEELGIPLGALEDPSSELYNKLSQDLLKGLPETYGSRILKVEVDNFLKTIPTLMNSPDGRRMIASNMLKLGEMKEVYYNEMRRQQKSFRDSNKPLPSDFQQEVFDQVKPQVDRINNEFIKLAEIKAVPQGTIPFFNPNGQVEFVPKEHAQWAQENGGTRIW